MTTLAKLHTNDIDTIAICCCFFLMNCRRLRQALVALQTALSNEMSTALKAIHTTEQQMLAAEAAAKAAKQAALEKKQAEQAKQQQQQQSADGANSTPSADGAAAAAGSSADAGLTPEQLAKRREKAEKNAAAKAAKRSAAAGASVATAAAAAASYLGEGTAEVRKQLLALLSTNAATDQQQQQMTPTAQALQSVLSPYAGALSSSGSTAAVTQPSTGEETHLGRRLRQRQLLVPRMHALCHSLLEPVSGPEAISSCCAGTQRLTCRCRGCMD